MILKRLFPGLGLKEFRDLVAIRPYSKIYTMLKSLPETMTRSGIKALLLDQSVSGLSTKSID